MRACLGNEAMSTSRDSHTAMQRQMCSTGGPSFSIGIFRLQTCAEDDNTHRRYIQAKKLLYVLLSVFSLCFLRRCNCYDAFLFHDDVALLHCDGLLLDDLSA